MFKCLTSRFRLVIAVFVYVIVRGVDGFRLHQRPSFVSTHTEVVDAPGKRPLQYAPASYSRSLDKLTHQLYLSGNVQTIVSNLNTQLQPRIQSLRSTLLPTIENLWATFPWKKEAQAGIPIILASSVVAGRLLGGKQSNPYKGQVAVYDQQKNKDFYNRRPWLVASRLFKMLSITMGFNMRILRDWKTGKLEANERDRAREVADILCKFGPTYVKLGQALSIRSDILPEAYCQELKKLQDSVTPFKNEVAMDILKRELKIKDLKEVFSSISAQPFASASIGQVYKAKLLNGKEVAVKIQRPDILDDIALDLHLMRMIAPFQVKIMNTINGNSTVEKEDISMAHDLVDEWGRGLIAELDYRTEAKNTMQFIEAMKSRGLNAVTSPTVVPHLSTDKVIVTEWIDGTRLDKDSSADVPR